MKNFGTRARGIVTARADVSLSTIVAQVDGINTAFAAFKEAQEAEIKALRKDVVQTEKVDRINADITTLTTGLDEMKASLDALRVGGGGDGQRNPDAVAHANAFNQFFRTGVDAGLRDLEVKAGLTTQSDPDGGYLVPDNVDTQISRVLGTVSAIRSLARVVPLSTGGTYKKLVNLGGAASGWVGEEAARPATANPTLSELSIATGEIYANAYATQRMLDDGRLDVAQWLADEYAVEFAEEEGAAFVSGDGINKPRGILGYEPIANASYAWGKIGFIVSGHASSFIAPTSSASPADCLILLHGALKSGYRNNAVWLMSDATEHTVRQFKNNDGSYIWAPPTVERAATILGKPVVNDDNMPGVAANQFSIAFGDFNRGYTITDVGNTSILRDPYTNKPHVNFYATKRVGGGVTNFEAIKLLKIST